MRLAFALALCLIALPAQATVVFLDAERHTYAHVEGVPLREVWNLTLDAHWEGMRGQIAGARPHVVAYTFLGIDGYGNPVPGRIAVDVMQHIQGSDHEQWGYGGSSLRIAFEVTAPVVAELWVFGSFWESDPVASTFVSSRLTGEAGTVVEWGTSDAHVYALRQAGKVLSNDSLDVDILLEPGLYEYEFSLHSDSRGNEEPTSNRGWTVLEFRALPEPGTALLFGSGLTGLSLWQSRTRRQRARLG